MTTLRMKSVGKELTTTPSVVYSVPAQFRAEVESIVICNDSNNTATVTVQWFDMVDGVWYDIIHSFTVKAYEFIQLENSLYLERGSSIRAFSGTHGVLTATLKIKETFANTNV